MKFFRVKNFYKYQGARRKSAEDSKPDWVAKWIKIHLKILDNFEFAKLSLSDRFIFIGLILLASKFKNVIPADPEYLQHRLRTPEPIELQVFIDLDFIEESDGKPKSDDES